MHQRRQLIGQRLAAAGRHDRQRVAARPAPTSMISACPGRRSRMWKTSRIFSSARCSAGRGGSAAASPTTIVGALAVTDGGVTSFDVVPSVAADVVVRAVGAADDDGRHTVVVGGVFAADLGSCRSAERYRCTGGRGGPGFVVGTQAELLSNRARTRRCGSTRLTLFHVPHSLAMPTCTRCKTSLRGSSQTTATLHSAGAGQETREPRASKTP